MKRIVASLLAIVVFAFSGLAIADISVKDGAGATKTIFNFVCFTTKLCNATVLVDSTGTEIVPATHADATAAVPCLNATAWNTNSYTTGQTNPLNCDLKGAPWFDLGAVNGIAISTGTGAVGTGTPRVAIGTDTATVAGSATLPAGTNRVGYTSDDPCTQKTKTTAAFTTSSGGPVSIVALSGSTVVYVCSISAITDTAIKLSFIDGTGGSCAAAQHAIWGSTTAANGMSLAANGGFTMGSGNGSVGVTTTASALCLLQSGTSLVAGNVTYVQQ